MLATLVIVLVAWAVMVPAVLGLARLLGRVSAPPAEAARNEPAAPPQPENVVALVPRPQNRLDAGSRRAA